ncbi:MAG: twin-arginine translocase TatA/TatE family subunit [Methylobacter sp.]|nr:twin-arginine translocase TatA/TatE family subunit [Methylobacter sp.]MDP2098356.1 twin-arginine translocase TatA/TatE family subunit [Methylobacter sp.]MDP2430164.1 twin-arginine translocase TatA/TatE family subunit [Methylobacter sp.]MDP3056349.1 twin-arginine translocase TatA/TatE family subunit [Methylobacter sp.]MDP3363291.1 twin-arginine translocase TatA/TatE family subunit [Methylobacter sp.]
MGPSITQLLVVLVIVIVIFGTKRLRNMGADLGGAIKGFRSAMKEGGETPAEDKADVIDSEITTEKKPKD